MKKLKIAYFGTPYFSARLLEKLLTDISIKHLIEIKLVVTQPDQPIGRKRVLTKSPVKTVAEKFAIEVLDFNLKNLLRIEDLKLKITAVDMAFLYAYGGIIPKKIIDLPRLGFWNTHPSLLPKYRGALPIAMPLILGDPETGVTLIKLDEKVDHGPIIAQEKLAISPNDKRPDLENKLTDLAFNLFKKVILPYRYRPIPEWYVKTKKQNHSQATITHQIKKDSGFIPLQTIKKALNNEELKLNEIPKILYTYLAKYNSIRNWGLELRNSSKIIYNYFRGLYPWPGIWTLVNIRANPSAQSLKRLKITGLNYSKGKLTITKVQLEGKKEVDSRTFNSAYSIF